MGGAAGPGLIPPSGAAAWRPLIQQTVVSVWPGLADGARWIEAQVHTESRGDPRAVSPSGAQGLLQLMPGTADEVGVRDPLDPAQNLHGGVTYLRRQYEAIEGRVPSRLEALRWSFAAYNCGRGYVVRALALAETDGGPLWWAWEPSWRYLFHRSAAVSGRWADYHQVRDYVERIQVQFGRIPIPDPMLFAGGK
jgi:soluble lytic murein transglycosylase-like protein